MRTETPFIIAIDGPAGSGKTTTAQLVSRALGFIYIDTGAMYRAVAYAVIDNGIPVSDSAAICRLLAGLRITFDIVDSDQHTFLNGIDIEHEIRSEAMSRAASEISRIPCVREEMVRLQRDQARRSPGSVLEGRDIGTVVFPDARCKFYLVADVGTRARRRHAQLLALGRTADLAAVEREILERDHNDAHRDHSPLRRANDAVEIDTTNLTIEGQVDEILRIVSAFRKRAAAHPDVRITIDTSAGFCWGVVRTIDIAERELQNGNRLVSLGDIIHNPREIERLHDLGMETISHDDIAGLEPGTKILIRAHGEPSSTYRQVRSRGFELVDATCPIVAKLQERIRKFYDEGFQVVIFGKKDHAEVIGLRGVCGNDCIVIKSLDEAKTLVQLDRRTVLFSQTTMDKPTFHAITDWLKARISELVVGSMEDLAIEFHAKDTICGQVSGREQKLRAFAAENDVMLFVAGRKSSNGRVLFDICREANPNTHFVEDLADIEPAWITGARRIGITGATSTPHWFMREVRDTLFTLIQ